MSENVITESCFAVNPAGEWFPISVKTLVDFHNFFPCRNFSLKAFFVTSMQTASSQGEILSLKFDENVFSPENKSPEKQQ